MLDQKLVNLIIKIVVIIATINWGLVAATNTDLVKTVTGGGDIEKYTKIAIGIVGVYFGLMVFGKV